ncbi:MAG: SDR family NAD(P)-dependent oxidoreductase [Proteobacteria bacterium]|nr:SDR family NAD(P)-dependent oxidoreductase [Pseudomonadota bacterium]
MNQIDLNGHKAVVTGAAQGLGYAIAQRLVESGASVSIWDIDGETLKGAVSTLSEIAVEGAVISSEVADVSDADAVDAALAGSTAALDGVDIVVNNAGISGPNVVSWEYDVAAWQKVVDINLTGTFLVCRAAIPAMRAAMGGSSTSPRWLAKKAIPTRRPIARPKRGSLD